jgi:hypothetical protein
MANRRSIRQLSNHRKWSKPAYGTRSALLLSRSEDGTLDFDSSPVVILSAEQAKHVGDEENQQYCPQPNAGPAARNSLKVEPAFPAWGILQLRGLRRRLGSGRCAEKSELGCRTDRGDGNQRRQFCPQWAALSR